MAEDIKRALAEIERLRTVVERLGSSNAMTLPFYNDRKTPAGRELYARMTYARDHLDRTPSTTDCLGS